MIRAGAIAFQSSLEPVSRCKNDDPGSLKFRIGFEIPADIISIDFRHHDVEHEHIGKKLARHVEHIFGGVVNDALYPSACRDRKGVLLTIDRHPVQEHGGSFVDSCLSAP